MLPELRQQDQIAMKKIFDFLGMIGYSIWSFVFWILMIAFIYSIIRSVFRLALELFR